MANRLPIIGGLLAVIAFIAWSSIFVVNEREQAIVVRFGEIQDVKTEPGLYFKLPFRLHRRRYGPVHRGPGASFRSRQHPRAGFRR
jgi:regulator of protease activity HflC (stomatin/prohibitin superfamily)